MAETGEEIEDLQGKGFGMQVLEIHEEKCSQMADHHGKSGDRADQVEGIRSRGGKLARHPGEEWEKEVPDEVQAPFQPFAWP